MREGLFYLPNEVFEKIMRFTEKFPKFMSKDTFQNFIAVIDAFLEEFSATA